MKQHILKKQPKKREIHKKHNPPNDIKSNTKKKRRKKVQNKKNYQPTPPELQNQEKKHKKEKKTHHTNTPSHTKIEPKITLGRIGKEAGNRRQYKREATGYGKNVESEDRHHGTWKKRLDLRG